MKTLLICEEIFRPANSGGAQRTALLHEALSECSEVHWLAFASPAAFTKAENESRRHGFPEAGRTQPKDGWVWKGLKCLPGRWGGAAVLLSQAIQPYALDRRLSGHLEELNGEHQFDAVVARYANPALQTGMDRLRGVVPTLVDLDDVPWRKIEAQVRAEATPPNWTKKWLNQARVRLVRQATHGRLCKMDQLWVAKAGDIEAFGKAEVSVLPNVPFHTNGREGLPAKPGSKTLLFVGTVDYEPNWEGLQWFLNRVWPKIIEQVPEAQLQIVGGLKGKHPVGFDSFPNVKYAGFVAELRDAYAGCAFTIAPIKWGGGTKIKVIESLAHGRTCVLTPQAWEGYEEVLKDGEALAVAGPETLFAERCLYLLAHPDERQRLAETGRAVVGARFTKDACNREVKRVLEKLVQTRHRQPVEKKCPVSPGLSNR
jgi:glycosyltransferase involved in cell wall biosynthesis